MKKIVFLILMFGLGFTQCSDHKTIKCTKGCVEAHKSCMERINDAEKCGFARINCLDNCTK